MRVADHNGAQSGRGRALARLLCLSLVTALAVGCAEDAGVGPAAGHAKGFTATWDWTGHKRELTYMVLPAVDGCLLVAPNDQDPAVGPLIGPPFSLGDGARRAAEIWNAAATGFTLKEVVAPPADIIIDKAPVAPAQLSEQASMDLLAVHTTEDVDDMDEVVLARITYNANVPLKDWGISGVATFDPIILMMHEFGHCFRLQDQAGIIMPNGGAGDVMRGILARGVHRWNPGGPPDPLGLRNPSVADIAEAKTSAATKLWPDEKLPDPEDGKDEEKRRENDPQG